ncbi:VENN motif pre-toxin domain-containing protein, partial [Gilliamella sp. WF3-4]|uniref:VENN motif pre-toxin domain-containing protein n=1 Tax=Gilliamella sp. WF3-4 TaxID=3120255 RepID=UPI0009C07AF2
TELSQEERQKISALSQLATGLAIAASGGDIQDVNTGIAAGKNAVENNNLAKATWYLVRPSEIGAQVSVNAVDLLMAKGLTAAESQAFLESLTLEQRRLIDLALVDPMGDEFLEDAVRKTYERYYNDYKNTIAIDPNDQPKLEGYPIPEPTPPFPGYTPIDPDKLGPNHTGHDGGLDDIDIRHDTGGNQIPDKDWRDYAINAEITRGEHAEIRNKQGRPVGQVINDIENSRPSDILVQDDGRWVVLGPNGRAHIIEPDGEIVTSLVNDRKNTIDRIKRGRWARPNSEKLQEFRDKFSKYFKR